jgi:multisubunit Na+/H+ antiporter MnhG subunit
MIIDREAQMKHMESTDDPGHGNSPAAWATVTIILVAFSIGTVFFFLEMAEVVIASAVLALLGPVVGFFMKRAGYGVGGSKTKSH